MDTQLSINIFITLTLTVVGSYIFYVVLDKVNKKEDFLLKEEIIKYTLFFIVYTGIIAFGLSSMLARFTDGNLTVIIITLISILLLVYPLVYINGLFLEIFLIGSLNKNVLKKYMLKLFQNRIIKFSIFSMQLMIFISGLNVIILGFLD